MNFSREYDKYMEVENKYTNLTPFTFKERGGRFRFIWILGKSPFGTFVHVTLSHLTPTKAREIALSCQL